MTRKQIIDLSKLLVGEPNIIKTEGQLLNLNGLIIMEGVSKKIEKMMQA